MSSLFKDAQSFSRWIVEITNERYRVVGAVSNFPPEPGSDWYLLSLGEIPKTAHAHKIWIDEQKIMIESMNLGNTVEWLEQDYGEEEAAEIIKPTASDFDGIREYFQKRFPLEGQRLDAYEEIVVTTSTMHKIDMSIRCETTSLVATFFLDAAIDTTGTNREQLATRMDRNLSGLKEAWDKIRDYERRRGNSRQARSATE